MHTRWAGSIRISSRKNARNWPSYHRDTGYRAGRVGLQHLPVAPRPPTGWIDQQLIPLKERARGQGRDKEEELQVYQGCLCGRGTRSIHDNSRSRPRSPPFRAGRARGGFLTSILSRLNWTTVRRWNLGEFQEKFSSIILGCARSWSRRGLEENGRSSGWILVMILLVKITILVLIVWKILIYNDKIKWCTSILSFSIVILVPILRLFRRKGHPSFRDPQPLLKVPENPCSLLSNVD